MTENPHLEKLHNKFAPYSSIGMRLTLSIGVIITLTIIFLFISIYQNEKEQHLNQIHTQAEALLSEMTVAREWVSSYNGVWTKSAGDYYLKTENGYYQKSPAMVTKELSNLSNRRGEYRFHITSLILTNPENTPDDFEHDALLQFEEEAVPVASVDRSGSEPVYRLMNPLKVQESCLECHDAQGYQAGDIRGGLSVLIPVSEMDESLARSRRMLTLSAISLVSFVMIALYVMVHRMVISPVGKLKDVALAVSDGNYETECQLNTGDELEVFGQTLNQMITNLKKTQGSLKRRVSQRTQELNTISEVALIISRAGALEDVLEEALEKVIHASEAAGGLVQLFDEEKIRIAAHKNLPSQIIQCFSEVKHEDDIPAPKEAILVRSIDKRVCRTLYPQKECPNDEACQAASAGYARLASVLLRSRSRPLGTMILFSKKEGSFSNEIMQLLESIGNQLGVAIENAIYHQRVEQIAVLEERTRISRELHDSLAQTLGWLSLKTEMLEEDLMLGAVERSNAEIKAIRSVVRDACYDVRESIDGLRTHPTGNFAVTAAAWIAEFRQRSGIETSFHARDGEVRLSPIVETELFRILQEALTNVRKHASAKEVQVSLDVQENFAELTVEDDGSGFAYDTEQADRHFGLGIMRERAERLGGSFELKSSLGSGTIIVAKLPLYPKMRSGTNLGV